MYSYGRDTERARYIRSYTLKTGQILGAKRCDEPIKILEHFTSRVKDVSGDNWVSGIYGEKDQRTCCTSPLGLADHRQTENAKVTTGSNDVIYWAG
jgi:hypothetical protein